MQLFGKSTIKTSGFAVTISITLVLLLVGMMAFVVLNTDSIVNKTRLNLGMVRILLKNDVSDADARLFQEELAKSPYTWETEYISREEAAASFTEEVGQDFVKLLGYNPLCSSINLRTVPAYAVTDSLAMISDWLFARSEVQDVSYQPTLVNRVHDALNTIVLILGAFTLLMLVVAGSLMSGMIHLTIYAQRFTIKTMQLVGAKARFIRAPYVNGMVWRGVVGFIFSSVMFLLLLIWVQRSTPQLTEFIAPGTIIATLLFMVVGGILLTYFVSLRSVNFFLRKRINSLYS